MVNIKYNGADPDPNLISYRKLASESLGNS